LPNFTAFESTMGLSAVIFFEHFNDETVRGRLQSIWREVIAKILHIREESSRWERAMWAFLRERIFSFVIVVAFGLLREFPDYNIITDQGLEAFFQLGTAEKALYRRLIQYIDVAGNYSREQMENDYYAVIKINNLFLIFVEQMG